MREHPGDVFDILVFQDGRLSRQVFLKPHVSVVSVAKKTPQLEFGSREAVFFAMCKKYTNGALRTVVFEKALCKSRYKSMFSPSSIKV